MKPKFDSVTTGLLILIALLFVFALGGPLYILIKGLFTICWLLI